MSRWLLRLRGAIGMGLTWAFAWAMVGLLIGVAMEFFGVPMGWFVQVFDAPLPALAVPGFLSGATFSTVLGVAGRRRRFDQLSLPRFTLWGALGGLLVGLVPLVVGGPGIPPGAVVVMLGALTVLSAGSAAGSLALARMAEDRELLDAGVEASAVGLTEWEARELMGK